MFNRMKTSEAILPQIMLMGDISLVSGAGQGNLWNLERF
jgi:hypothetical protein